ncbi:MAG: hypothetical protein ABLQ96_02950 [Candidatus Acidiferrum sp.]
MSAGSSASMRHDESGKYNRNALVARAGVVRTFGGLGGFLALIFLGAGIYLLQEAFSDPLRAEAVGLIAGAFIIALSTILVYFLCTPPLGYRRSKIRRRARSRAPQRDIQVATPVAVALTLPIPVVTKENGADMPLPA